MSAGRSFGAFGLWALTAPLTGASIAQEPYYEARLRILELPAEVSTEQIYPGMPVDALIATQERTFADFQRRVNPLMDNA